MTCLDAIVLLSLAVCVAVVPAAATPRRQALPPDPGADGDATVAGTDSDKDGLRDDVQRYIVLTYPDDLRTQRALGQLARSIQAAVLDAESRGASESHAHRVARAIECLRLVRGEDATRAESELMRQVLDTEARGRAYLAYESQIESLFLPIRPADEWHKSCEFLSTTPLTPAGTLALVTGGAKAP